MKHSFTRGLPLAAVLVALVAGAAVGMPNVVAWGSNMSGQTNVPADLTDAVAVAAGEAHCLALRADGSVVAWGHNASGQADVPMGLGPVVAVAAGPYHSLAVLSNGTVKAWGEYFSGPTNMPAGLSGVVEAAGGWQHNLALRANGTVVAWGDNASGQTNVPAGLTNVVAVAAGSSHCLALRADGTVAAWGDSSGGKTTVPTILNDAVAVAAGGGHSLALRANGTVVAWGENWGGQTNVPSGLSNVVVVAAGEGHSLAVRADGTVVAWGSAAAQFDNIPEALSNVVAAAGGSYHSIAAMGTGRPFLPPMVNRIKALKGGSVFLRVRPSGEWPMSCLWEKDGVPISGGTNALLPLTVTDINQAGAYRCVVSNAIGTTTSGQVWLSVIVPETVSTPSTPAGPAGGLTNQSLTFSTGGATNSADHPVEYRFGWGDGEVSAWGTGLRAHAWSPAGPYAVASQARCTSGHATSEWSASFSVTITNAPALPETVSIPITPEGPASGLTNQSLIFTSGGATNSADHPVEYGFDFGDGALTHWWWSNWMGHAWATAGTYSVRAQARCEIGHATSEWSASFSVTITNTPALPVPLPQFSFNASAFLAEEGTIVKVKVKRLGGSAVPISVDYLVKPGTAVAWKDYIPKSGTFVWDGGDTSSRAVKIDILADGKVEGNESFQIVLKNPVGATRADPYKATITIQSNSKAGPVLANVVPSRMAGLTDALDGEGLVWFASTQAPWTKQSLVTADGVDAAASGKAGVDTVSWLQTDLDGPGTLDFDWLVAGAGREACLLIVNGAVNRRRGPGYDWSHEVLTLGEGPHTVRWVFVGDNGLAPGTAYLDRVEWTPEAE